MRIDSKTAILPNEQIDTDKPPGESVVTPPAQVAGAHVAGPPQASKTRRGENHAPIAAADAPKRKRNAKPRGRTGPTTREGKARSRLNALKHGLATDLGIIPGHEDPDEWCDFRDGIAESLNPVGRLEEVLAELVARGLWRQDRAFRHEAYATTKHIERAAVDVAAAAKYHAALYNDGVVDEEAVLEDVHVEHLRRVLPAKYDIELTMRYEGHVQRQWGNALHEFQVLQARRLGERPNVMRFDVTHTPAA